MSKLLTVDSCIQQLNDACKKGETVKAQKLIEVLFSNNIRLDLHKLENTPGYTSCASCEKLAYKTSLETVELIKCG